MTVTVTETSGTALLKILRKPPEAIRFTALTGETVLIKWLRLMETILKILL